jgi:hypothetical protein
MFDWVDDLKMKIKGFVLLEEYVRDSLENKIFSISRFYQFFGEFPKEISIITWKFNKRRFEIFAKDLGLKNFDVISVGEREGQEKISKS